MTITYQATFGRLRVRDIVCLILRFGLRVRFCGPALRIVTPLGALYDLYLYYTTPVNLVKNSKQLARLAKTIQCPIY